MKNWIHYADFHCRSQCLYFLTISLPFLNKRKKKINLCYWYISTLMTLAIVDTTHIYLQQVIAVNRTEKRNSKSVCIYPPPHPHIFLVLFPGPMKNLIQIFSFFRFASQEHSAYQLYVTNTFVFIHVCVCVFEQRSCNSLSLVKEMLFVPHMAICKNAWLDTMLTVNKES